MALEEVRYTFGRDRLPIEHGGESKSQGLIWATNNALRRGLTIDDLLQVTFTYETEDVDSPHYIESDEVLDKVAHYMVWRAFTLADSIWFARNASRHAGHAFTRSRHRLMGYGFSYDEMMLFCKRAISIVSSRRALARKLGVSKNQVTRLYSIDNHEGPALGANRGIRLANNERDHRDPGHPVNSFRRMSKHMDQETAADWLLYDYDADFATEMHSLGMSAEDIEAQVYGIKETLDPSARRTLGISGMLEIVLLRARGEAVPPVSWIAATL